MWDSSVSFSYGYSPIAPCFKHLCTGGGGGGGGSVAIGQCCICVRLLRLGFIYGPQYVVRGCLATSRDRCGRLPPDRWQPPAVTGERIQSDVGS